MKPDEKVLIINGGDVIPIDLIKYFYSDSKDTRLFLKYDRDNSDCSGGTILVKNKNPKQILEAIRKLGRGDLDVVGDNIRFFEINEVEV